MSKNQIMYIEFKGSDIVGPGRIGRVTFSKTGKTIKYKGKVFQSLSGMGYKANYFDVKTRDRYWISGCRKDGNDTLYPNVVEIDSDVAEEYWIQIRNIPANVGKTKFRAKGKYSLGGRETK